MGNIHNNNDDVIIKTASINQQGINKTNHKDER